MDDIFLNYPAEPERLVRPHLSPRQCGWLSVRRIISLRES
ncbi:hypothetical protein HMPREF0868_0193 [Mageeibacillus indolicus UPII9-5]|uniref:Uncharacterized protein n=1 Tax=Mageeibacillus indolicus (strain UPII9-5) TaxID=699246 RepID=D3R027_MAGIU|nr:hypothetical protein HMPREF0868_0193 [Mageeibacillus indolicus UPII9-5]